MKVITQSELKDFQRCRRRWWLAHYRRLRKLGEYRSPLVVGNVVHDGLARYYAGELEHPLEWVKTEAERLIEELPEASDFILKDAELAGIMLDGYMEWVEETGADANLEAIEPERTLQAELKPGVAIRGKLDARFRLRDSGFRGFIEHKTTGSFNDLLKTAQQNPQFLHYHLLEYLEAVEQGMKPDEKKTDGVILNMLRKVKRSAQAKPPFYQREEVRHNIHELRNHWRHVVGLAGEITALEARLARGEDPQYAAPPNPTKDCSWDCAFRDVCPMFDDGSDAEGFLELMYEEHDPLARYGEM